MRNWNQLIEWAWKQGIKFVALLWGIEIRFKIHGGRLTEEFVALLWGIEIVYKIIRIFHFSPVCSSPMRNWNLEINNDLTDTLEIVCSSPMRNWNLAFLLSSLLQFFLVCSSPMRNWNLIKLIWLSCIQLKVCSSPMRNWNSVKIGGCFIWLLCL